MGNVLERISYLRVILTILLLSNNLHCVSLSSLKIQTSRNNSPSFLPRFIGTPLNQTAFAGENVKFVCIVENIRGIVQWTKDGFGLGDVSAFPNYSMPGNKHIGDFSLIIYKVTPEDEGLFECQVSPGPDGIGALRSPGAFLTVEVDATEPMIVQETPVKATEGQTVTLECRSGGKPFPEITWLNGSGVKFSSGVVNMSESVATGFTEDSDSVSNRSVNLTSFLSFKADRKYDGNIFTCQVRRVSRSLQRRKKVMKASVHISVIIKKEADSCIYNLTKVDVFDAAICNQTSVTSTETITTENMNLPLESYPSDENHLCDVVATKTTNANANLLIVSIGASGFFAGVFVTTVAVVWIYLRCLSRQEINVTSSQPMLINPDEQNLTRTDDHDQDETSVLPRAGFRVVGISHSNLHGACVYHRSPVSELQNVVTLGPLYEEDEDTSDYTNPSPITIVDKE